MKKIVIIEDDIWIIDSLKLYLENSNFDVYTHMTWLKATEYVLDKMPDIVILDINLPEKDGIEICKEIRKTSQIPIIMLTARNSEIDKILWLEIWADDYVSKPFSPRELLARINSILRRVKAKQNPKELKYDDIVMDLDRFIVKKWNKEVLFTKSEFNILRKLIEENWKVVTRDTLMKEIIWYEQYIFDRTIDTHIKNVRKKIWNKDLILTVRGEGYRIVS